MANPFKTKPPVEKSNRNTFDLSHNANFTAKFGKLYPVLCQEVLPGDSFEIEGSLGLRLMPLSFPVQSRMRADVHYFFVRNRNLWKDWKDFIFAQKEGLTPPWIQRLPTSDTNGVFGTGELGDYLGIPTTVATSQKKSYNSVMVPVMSQSELLHNIYGTEQHQNIPIPQNVPNDAVGWEFASVFPTITASGLNWNIRNFKELLSVGGGTGTKVNALFGRPLCRIEDTVTATSRFNYLQSTGTTYMPTRIYLFLLDRDGNTKLGAWTVSTLSYTQVGSYTESQQFTSINVKMMFSPNSTVTLDNYINTALGQGYSIMPVFQVAQPGDLGTIDPRQTKFVRFFNGIQITDLTNTIIGSATDDYSKNPYIGPNPDIKISALPYRAYESIYNSFYRNTQNDPFRIGGVAEYNKFIPTDAGGADTNDYALRNRNWEIDFLTSAMPSPQQGIAPLVGGRQFTDKTYTINFETGQLQLKAGDTGELTAISTYGDATVDEPTIKALESAIGFGISINDFRNVNSLQRWLEKNVRHGYRYKDQMEAHFGIEISLRELDMPEFLGGFSQDVNVNTVTQTVQMSDSSPLGAFAGQGSCYGKAQNKVNHYFDEHGFVFAIFSVSPIPSYSQLLPKMLQKMSHLDYYSREFAHIGLQPITYREVCPNEAKNLSIPLDKVFGYQRPFYDYLACTDRVHGEMRTSLRGFLVNRYFSAPPELGAEFLQLKSDEVNNIFTVNDDQEDKIIGQIYFNMKAKRGIPRFAEGRLE